MPLTKHILISDKVEEFLEEKRKYKKESYNDILERELGLGSKKDNSERRLKKK